jgi:hypothetical protein
LCEQLAGDPLAEAREQREVVRAQQAQRVLQFAAVLVAEASDDDERAPAVRPRSSGSATSV